MAKVLLARSGTVLYGSNAQASPVAGNQDALGVLRYLCQSGHEVAVLGPTRGDFPVRVFNVDFARTPYGSTPPAEYLLRINLGLSEVGRWAPQVCVNLAGQCPTSSDPVGPYGTHPLRSAITTNFPVIKACHDFKIPRVVVLNDPRCLPREQELIYMRGAAPVAVLSQRTRTSFWNPIRLKGTVRRTEVYAACENWWTYDMPLVDLQKTSDRSGIVVLAHAHFNDERVGGLRRKITWDRVLQACQDPVEIYGQGWENYPGWRGCVKHNQVQEVLQRYTSGPLVSLTPDFVTGKVREYVMAGCLPRPVSFGPYHYDKDCRYFPADSPARIKDGPWSNVYDRALVEELREKTTPNFNPLEEVIEAVVNKRPHRWGGFFFE